LVLCLMVGAAPAATVYAAQSTSSSYSVDQVFFGNGGELNACSTSYCTKQAAGETTVGNTSSTTLQSQTGFNVDRQEYLEFKVNTTSLDLGVLSSSFAKTGTATFSVKAYLSSGYQVVTASDPPTNGARALNAMAGGASTPGTEQFGINLVANTSPTALGADPVQVPGAAYSFGTAAAGYNTANQYKYVKGDVIAQSLKSSGETDYTLSYLMNISNVTPGGTYTMRHVLVATATF
jgi:hypothetical protein